MSFIYLRPDPSPSPGVESPAKIILSDGKVAADEACCCNCGCFLPYTTTVTFNELVNKTHTTHCALSISSDFGGGAYAVGIAPGGCDDFQSWCKPSNRGPLTSVLLVDGGNGYAIIGRVEPTLKIKGSGKGAEFTPTLVKDETGSCPFWYIESISVTGGIDYTNKEFLVITASKGDTVIENAVARLEVFISHIQPELTAVVGQGGTGSGQNASLGLSLTNDGNDPPNWFVSSVNVNSGGVNYFPRYPELTETIPVSFLTNDIIVAQASAALYPAVKIPENLITETWGAGNGAVVTPTFQQNTYTYFDSGGNQREAIYWSVASVNIQNGGENYNLDDYIYIVAEDDTTGFNICYLRVIDIDANGSILSLSIDYAGIWRESINGTIQGVYIINGGSYYREGPTDGVPKSVEIINGGNYYRNDVNVPACVADITVTACGNGNGAEIVAVVDQNPDSATFGQIIGLNIINGGDDYLVWEWICSDHDLINNKKFVLKAQNAKRLVNLEIKSCFGGGGAARIEDKGPRFEPTLDITAPCGGFPSISYTLSQSEDGPCQPYWSISSAAVDDPCYCYLSGPTKATVVPGDIPYGCATVIEENADIDLTSDSFGLLNGASVAYGGKYYQQFEWNGEPSPIYSVELTDPGFGYAKIHREEPDLSLGINSVSGNGAEIDFEIIEKTDKCGVPYWVVDKLTIENPGLGYEDYDTVYMEYTEPNKSEKQIVATIFVIYEKPEITATINSDNGSGAEIKIDIRKTNKTIGNRTVRGWEISNIYVCGGKNYEDGDYIEIDYGGANVQTQPEFELTIDKGRIICAKIVASGFFKMNNDGAIKQIKLSDKGIFYKENKDLPPYIADIEVLIHQEEGSNGYDAVIKPIIWNDPYDESTFGKIKKLVLENCGQNYSYFGGPMGCQYAGGCQVGCSVGAPSILLNMPNRKNKPLNLFLYDTGITLHFRSENIENCNNPFPVEADLLYGAPSGIVMIEASGIWDSTGTDDCPDDCNACPRILSTPTVMPFLEPDNMVLSNINNSQILNINNKCILISVSIQDPYGGNNEIYLTYFNYDISWSAFGYLLLNPLEDPFAATLQYFVNIDCSDKGRLIISASATLNDSTSQCPSVSGLGSNWINSDCRCNEEWSGTYTFEIELYEEFANCPLESLGTVTANIQIVPCPPPDPIC